MYRQCELFTVKLNINIYCFSFVISEPIFGRIVRERVVLLCSVLDTIKM